MDPQGAGAPENHLAANTGVTDGPELGPGERTAHGRYAGGIGGRGGGLGRGRGIRPLLLDAGVPLLPPVGWTRLIAAPEDRERRQHHQ